MNSDDHWDLQRFNRNFDDYIKRLNKGIKNEKVESGVRRLWEYSFIEFMEKWKYSLLNFINNLFHLKVEMNSEMLFFIGITIFTLCLLYFIIYSIFMIF